MAITATMAEAQNDYYKAMRAGKREGETLPNLDDILKEENIVAVREVPLGLVQIPSDRRNQNCRQKFRIQQRFQTSAERKHRICIQMDGPVQGASE